jgi:hypothetical protein
LVWANTESSPVKGYREQLRKIELRQPLGRGPRGLVCRLRAATALERTRCFCLHLLGCRAVVRRREPLHVGGERRDGVVGPLPEDLGNCGREQCLELRTVNIEVGLRRHCVLGIK